MAGWGVVGSARFVRRHPGIIAGVVVLILIMIFVPMFVSSSTKNGNASESYATALRSTTNYRSAAGGYSIELPQGWSIRDNGPYLSIESPDKHVNVDYVRDARLDAAKVQKMVAQNSGPAKALPAEKHGSVTMLPFVGSGGGKSTYAVLHQPAGNAPALAMIDAPSDVFEKLPNSVIGALAVSNMKMQQIATAKPSVTPAPSPTVVATPVQTAKPTATVIAQASPSVSPQPTVAVTPIVTPPPAATEVARPTPAAIATASPPAATIEVANPGLGVTLRIPPTWNSRIDRRAGITTVESPDGMQVRVARDAEALQARAVFDGMQAEGWEVLNENENKPVEDRRFSIAEMRKGMTRLLILLLDQADNSTLIMYATSNSDFTTDQRRQVADIVRQMAKSSAR